MLLYLFCFVCAAGLIIGFGSEGRIYSVSSGIILFILPIPVITNYRNFLRQITAKSAFGAALKRTICKAVIVAGLWTVWAIISIYFDLYPNITV